jgi:hypothetical protein
MLKESMRKSGFAVCDELSNCFGADVAVPRKVTRIFQQDGHQSVAKSRDRQAVEDLVMQYRIERASRWMGKIGLLIFASAAVAAVISLFRPKYL